MKNLGNNENGNELYKEISKGIIHSKYSGVGAGSTIAEILAVSIFFGIYYRSWWLFGGLLFGLSILMYFKITRLLLLILFAIGWVLIAWTIGSIFDSLGASVVLSCIALVISLAVHRSAYEEWKEGW